MLGCGSAAYETAPRTVIYATDVLIRLETGHDPVSCERSLCAIGVQVGSQDTLSNVRTLTIGSHKDVVRVG